MAIFGVAFGYPEGEPDTAVEPAVIKCSTVNCVAQ